MSASFMCRVLQQAILASMMCAMVLSCQTIDRSVNRSSISEYTDVIEARISTTTPVARHGDTLYFKGLECHGSHPCHALLIDSVAQLERQPNKALAVMRVFDTSNDPWVSGDSTVWKAVTYLGTGRGYEVQMALALLDVSPNKTPRILSFDLDCGYWGSGFRLPNWTIHEFDDDDELLPWGAMVLHSHNSHMGFGYQEVAIIDLGQVNHMETTLRHRMDSESIFIPDEDSMPSDMLAVLAEFNSQRPGKKPHTYLERHWEGRLDWHFDGRTLNVTEHSQYMYWGGSEFKDNERTPPIKKNPDVLLQFAQTDWPPFYRNISSLP